MDATRTELNMSTTKKKLATSKKQAHIGIIIRMLREKQGIRSVDLARLSNVNPVTLAAIESGRIKNPSLDSIQSVAKALQMSTAEFFALVESQELEGVYHGSQKGAAVLDFKQQNFRLVSNTPLTHQFFIGKVMLDGGGQIDSEVLALKTSIFIQLIIGKLVVRAGLKEYFLKEGDHFLVSQYVSRSITNPSLREATFSLTTFPSFL